MSTTIRPELSKKNIYYISKHKYYELKHFCLQYGEWKKEKACFEAGIFPGGLRLNEIKTKWNDPTAIAAMRIARCNEKIELVERVAWETDKEITKYILKAVTEGRSYEYLNVNLNIPCGRDYFYERYRKFFWLLSKER